MDPQDSCLYVYALPYMPPFVLSVLIAHVLADSSRLARSSSVQSTYTFPGLPGTGCAIADRLMFTGRQESLREQFSLMFFAAHAFLAFNVGETTTFLRDLVYLPMLIPPPFCSIFGLVTVISVKSTSSSPIFFVSPPKEYMGYMAFVT